MRMSIGVTDRHTDDLCHYGNCCNVHLQVHVLVCNLLLVLAPLECLLPSALA